MGTLVDDLLHLARLDQGRPLDRSPVDLRALIDDAVRDARAVDPGRDVRGMVDAPIMVIGDRARLHQVVANLVSNALVHAPGAAIELRARAADGAAVLEVADDGPGLYPEEAAKVFERFYRADPSRNRNQGGTGLGLSIVAAVAEAHGGQARVESVPGHGARFWVELPAALAQ